MTAYPRENGQHKIEGLLRLKATTRKKFPLWHAATLSFAAKRLLILFLWKSKMRASAKERIATLLPSSYVITYAAMWVCPLRWSCSASGSKCAGKKRSMLKKAL